MEFLYYSYSHEFAPLPLALFVMNISGPSPPSPRDQLRPTLLQGAAASVQKVVVQAGDLGPFVMGLAKIFKKVEPLELIWSHGCHLCKIYQHFLPAMPE